MREASTSAIPHRRLACTGVAVVPCFLGDMMDSSPERGRRDPGAAGAPTQPFERPPSEEDISAEEHELASATFRTAARRVKRRASIGTRHEADRRRAQLGT